MAAGPKKENVFLNEIGFDDSKQLRDLKQYRYFIILPDDPFKRKWEMIVAA